jgi:hypothetical protein
VKSRPEAAQRKWRTNGCAKSITREVSGRLNLWLAILAIVIALASLVVSVLN